MREPITNIEDPRLPAAVELIARTGAEQFQVRYSDDEEPTIWIAAGLWRVGPNGRRVRRGGKKVWETAAAIHPVRAVLRLLDQIIDGGQCSHCHRPTAVTDDWKIAMPLSDQICWYVFDPEVKKYRRSCEGST